MKEQLQVFLSGIKAGWLFLNPSSINVLKEYPRPQKKSSQS